jgi:hypothetical protein
MCSFRFHLKRSGLPVLLVLCLAALSVSYASADEANRPRALQIIGDPDAAVNGRFAVGTGSVGSKALTVVGVIDFLGTGTVHNYFTQGTGNNMQINTNVDESNVVSDASRSQWKLVLGSSLDWFSIRRSPAGGTYNEDALFFIEGSTGNVGLATVDTNNAAAIPFSFQARLHVVATPGSAIYGYAAATSGVTFGVFGRSASTSGIGVRGYTSATTGITAGVNGESASSSGRGVFGYVASTTGTTYGVFGASQSNDGTGVYGEAAATTGVNYGVYGRTYSTGNNSRGVYGWASTSTGYNYGVVGQADSTGGTGVFGWATATSGPTYGVYGRSDSAGTGVYGYESSAIGGTGVHGRSEGQLGVGVSGSGGWEGVRGHALNDSGVNYGVYGSTDSPSGYGVYFSGGLAGTGTKTAIVQTQEYGWRHLYAVESPENWFEDFGQATLAGGEAVVAIEPIFAQTVNLGETYHVFLTPLGECGLFVAEKTSTSFTVRALEGAACEIAFDYRIIAPRLDYEDLRLEPAEDPEAVAASLPAAPPEPPTP